MSIIIFGASGFLGGELMNYFTNKNVKVIGTYFNKKKEGLLKFDLEKSELKDLNADLSEVTHAIICGAITNMDSCRTKDKITYKINVLRVKKLILELYNMNIVPIFISTDYVFDGSKGNYSESDLRKPVLAYGAQKKEVEDFLIGSQKNHIIARLSRVYSLNDSQNTILTAIAKELREGKTLTLASDQVFTPTFIGDACKAIDILIEKNFTGAINICGSEQISRYDLAKLIKSELNIQEGTLKSCSLKDLKFGDNRPLNTSMSNQKFIDMTGFRLTTLKESIGKLKQLKWRS